MQKNLGTQFAGAGRSLPLPVAVQASPTRPSDKLRWALLASCLVAACGPETSLPSSPSTSSGSSQSASSSVSTAASSSGSASSSGGIGSSGSASGGVSSTSSSGSTGTTGAINRHPDAGADAGDGWDHDAGPKQQDDAGVEDAGPGCTPLGGDPTQNADGPIEPWNPCCPGLGYDACGPGYIFPYRNAGWGCYYVGGSNAGQQIVGCANDP